MPRPVSLTSDPTSNMLRPVPLTSNPTSNMPGLFLFANGNFVIDWLEHYQPVNQLELNVLDGDSSGALFKQYTAAERVKTDFVAAKEQDRFTFEENNDEDYNVGHFKILYNKVCECLGCRISGFPRLSMALMSSPMCSANV